MQCQAENREGLECPHHGSSFSGRQKVTGCFGRVMDFVFHAKKTVGCSVADEKTKKVTSTEAKPVAGIVGSLCTPCVSSMESSLPPFLKLKVC